MKTNRMNSAICMSKNHKYCYVDYCDCSCHYINRVPDYAKRSSIDALACVSYECWSIGTSLSSGTLMKIIENGVNAIGHSCSNQEIEAAAAYVREALTEGAWSRSDFDHAINNNSNFQTETLF